MKVFLFIASILICFNVIFALGQNRDLSKEYERVINNSLDKLKSVSYRKKIKQEYTDNKPRTINEKGENTATNEKILSVKNITSEFSPPNKWHKIEAENFKIISFTDSYFNQTSYKETISIGDKIFRKGKNNKWEEFNLDADTNKGFPIIELGKDIVEYKFIDSEIINNQKANIYEIAANSKTSGSNINERYWINSDNGILIKEEYEANLYNGERIIKSTTKYEYDSTIKVELPK